MAKKYLTADLLRLARQEFARSGARACNASLTPEQRSGRAKKAAVSRWNAAKLLKAKEI